MTKKRPASKPPEPHTIELSPTEVAAIVLCGEENHRHMLSMAESHKHDPIWAKYAEAWASIRRKLTGTDELT